MKQKEIKEKNSFPEGFKKKRFTSKQPTKSGINCELQKKKKLS